MVSTLDSKSSDLGSRAVCFWKKATGQLRGQLDKMLDVTCDELAFHLAGEEAILVT